MEKNKKRTDLLAAGKKKLHQYRQKKDTKSSSSSGSHGKSSHKTSKQDCGRDAKQEPFDSSNQPALDHSIRTASDNSLVSHAVENSSEGTIIPGIHNEAEFFGPAVSPEEVSESRTAVAAEAECIGASLVMTRGEGETMTITEVEITPVDSSIPMSEGEAILTVDGEVASVDSSFPSSEGKTMMTVDSDVAPGDSSLPSSEGEASMATNSDVAPADSSVPSSGGEAMMMADSEVVHVDSLAASSEGDAVSSSMPTIEEAGGGSITLVEKDRAVFKEVNEPLHLQEDPPHTFLVQMTDGDVISDIVDQEADRPDLDQCDGNGKGSQRFLQESRDSAITHDEASDSQPGDVDVNSFHNGDLENALLCHDSAIKQEGRVQENVEQTDDLEVQKQQRIPDGATILENRISEDCLEIRKASMCGEQAISLGKNGSVDLYGLAKVLGGLNEEEVRFVLKLSDSASVEDLPDTSNRILLQGGFADSLESLKQQVYLANVADDFLHLQLAEQMEFEQQDQHLIDELSNLRALVREMKEKNTSMGEEVMSCSSELQVMATEKEELEKQCLSLRAECDELSADACKLQNKLKQSEEDVRLLSAELADCKSLMGNLEVENASLTRNLILSAEERRRLEQEREYFSSENTKLAAELSEHGDSLVMARDKQLQLEDELKEAVACFEQLTKENIYLSHCLDVHRMKIKEIDDTFLQLLPQAGEVNNQLGSSSVQVVVMDKLREGSQVSTKASVGGTVSNLMGQLIQPDYGYGSSLQRVAQRDVDDCVCMVVLKEHLEETERIVQKLEKAIQGMHAHSVSLSRSGDKMASSGVSKLILAFESKVHHDETILNEAPLTEGEHSTDSFKLAKEQSYHLADMLKQMWSDVEKVDAILKEDQDGKGLATATLKGLEAEHEAQKIQTYNLELKNSQLVKKLTEYQSRTDDLQSQLYKVEHDATDMVGNVLDQIQFLQKEVGQKMSILENERNSLMATIFYLVEKLDTCTQRSVSPSLTTSDVSDIGACFTASVNAATEAIEGLQGKLKTAYLDHDRVHNRYEELNQELSFIHGRNEVAIGILGNMYGNIRNLIKDSFENLEEIDMTAESEELLDILPNKFETVLQQLQKLLEERQHLQSKRKDLEEELMNRTQVIDELNKQCLDLASRLEENETNAPSEMIVKLVKDLETVIQPEDGEIGSDKLPVLRLESLVAVLLKKYGEAIEQISMSKRFLQEFTSGKDIQAANWMQPLHLLLQEEFQSKVIELSELQAQEIEELNRRCLDLASQLEANETNAPSEVIVNLVKDLDAVLQSEDRLVDSEKLPLMHLESSLAFLLKKYSEIVEQVSMSKRYLQEITSRKDVSTADWMRPLHTVLREEFESKVAELNELQEKMHQLDTTNLHPEDEILSLKESLGRMEEALRVAESELHARGTELEQSEQRLSSVREKLSIAVAKGKGLIVQRDGLKQSLVEKSSEIDKCLQELQSKDAVIHDFEAKLKVYSEGGERIEALESELSYIRNSAAAMRESFLLKDSVIQRIEEILEDLELPEHFHSRDTIEKIEWLARSITGNSLPLTDWDQKSSMGGSYSDGGFVVMDKWKEDPQLASNPGIDDLRRKYDELQSKFYALAEHNDMLEQSLVERNNLVQRWEEVLDRINMPPQLRSLEPEDRIELLGRVLSEAQDDRNSLQLRIENLETSSESMVAELEESQKKSAELRAALVDVTREKESISADLEEAQKKSIDLRDLLVDVTREKEILSESLEELGDEHGELVKKAYQGEVDCENLRKEIADLQEKLVQNLENHSYTENEIEKLLSLVSDAFDSRAKTDPITGRNTVKQLEGLLRKLIDKYTTFSSEKFIPTVVEKEHVTGETNESHEVDTVKHALASSEAIEEDRVKDALALNAKEVLVLKAELDAALANLVLVKEDRDATLEKCQSLILELEATCKERDDLQEQFKQEELKSASAREKLNIAVRKGKGLVQQRDSLKQTMEAMNAEVENLKRELKQRENAILQFEQQIRDLSTFPGKVETLESENLLLKNQLAETELSLHDSSQTLNGLLTALHAIDVGGEVNYNDPMQKMEGISKLNSELHAAALSSAHEEKRSKRAAELLVAELNEVQERADSLQEELVKAEYARLQANSNLEQFITVHSEERKKQQDDLMGLKAVTNKLRRESSGLANLLESSFSKDLELFLYVEACTESFLKQISGTAAVDLPHFYTPEGVLDAKPMNGDFSATNASLELTIQDDSVMTELLSFVGRGLQDCMKEIDDLKRKCDKHSITLDQQIVRLPKIMETIKKEVTSQKEFSDSLKKDIAGLELWKKEKDSETSLMHRSITLLYEACINSISEFEKCGAHRAGESPPSGMHVLGQTAMSLKLPARIDGSKPEDGRGLPFTEEGIRMVADTLLSAVKGSVERLEANEECNQTELRATILQLQKELEEKDTQRNRICSELVNQIKEVEATAKGHLVDLDFTKTQMHNLEQQVEVMKNEHGFLESRVNELKHWEATSKELQEKIKSLIDMLNAKDQEIEDLMQALDDEESQMAGRVSRTEELEKVLQQKNLEIESLEASRGKAMEKLSVTVNKFNELHHLSESVLSEVENLQSQLQGKDAEISFLRQEVTRCTNDVLASKESNKKNYTEVHQMLTWLNTMVSRFGTPGVHVDDHEGSRIDVCMEILEKHIATIMSELNDLRMTAQSKDGLLQDERSKVEGLLHKAEILEISLHEKDSQLQLLQGERDSGHSANVKTLDYLDVEQMRNKKTVISGPIAPRGGRKVNNDQVAIGIDVEADNSNLDDEDDDKAHGFKSLTMSRIVPKATRPIADRMDGLWVSVDRMLMRQPSLRLGLVMYWIMLHVLLATSIV